MSENFEPNIVAFVCNWCTYTGADLAGTSRMHYAPNIRLIRLPCSGRIEAMYIIKAFEQGADGVLVSGCHPGDCHYTSGNYFARRRFNVFRNMIDFLGIDIGRIQFAWISASEGGKFVEIVNDFTKRIKEKGPYEEFKTLTTDAYKI